ncbi:MAG: hypothetical protein RBS57_07580 [Desulforhabdus sp.]|jgi:hypothetical protein|nr:hypothetical protein [Desulforhabdus sp.]
MEVLVNHKEMPQSSQVPLLQAGFANHPPSWALVAPTGGNMRLSNARRDRHALGRNFPDTEHTC